MFSHNHIQLTNLLRAPLEVLRSCSSLTDLTGARRAEERLGGEKSNKYRKLIKHLNETANRTRQELRTKYEKKIEHLKRKYMDDKETELDKVPEEIEEFGGVVVFNKEKFENIKIEEIEIVKYGDVETSKDEEAVLRLHPKMAIARKLQEGFLAVNQDLGYTKVRWQLMKEDEMEPLEEKRKRDAETKEEKLARMRKEEETDIQDARTRQVYNPEEKSYDERKMRVTDMEECTRVNLPKPLKVKREAEIEMRREMHKKISEEYRKEKCDDRDNQEDNLTPQERRGLRSLEKRKTDGEIIIAMTDKSTKLCIMKREDYLKLGEDHVNPNHTGGGPNGPQQI